jgi:hypothetical protein
MSSDQTDERVDRARRLLLSQMEVTAEVHSSDDWFKKRFPYFQDRNDWMDDTVFGLHSTTRFPHFVGYVVFNLDVGKSTAGIIERALTCGRPVLYIQGESLKRVRAITCNEAESWSHGWTVHTEDLKNDNI